MAWDPVWEELFRTRAWGKYPGEDLIRFVARNFYKASDRKQIKLLEVGCGTGANIWFIAREGFSVYGIDGSETAIHIAKQRLDMEVDDWQGDLQVGDIMQLPYEDAFFDAVIDNEAINCNSIEDSKVIYREMARVTKPGGKLFSRTFASGCWGEGSGASAGHHAWYVSEGPLQSLGLVRFTSNEEISELIEQFYITETEMITRTMENQTETIKEWIIQGIKK